LLVPSNSSGLRLAFSSTVRAVELFYTCVPTMTGDGRVAAREPPPPLQPPPPAPRTLAPWFRRWAAAPLPPPLSPAGAADELQLNSAPSQPSVVRSAGRRLLRGAGELAPPPLADATFAADAAAEPTLAVTAFNGFNAVVYRSTAPLACSSTGAAELMFSVVLPPPPSLRGITSLLLDSSSPLASAALLRVAFSVGAGEGTCPSPQTATTTCAELGACLFCSSKCMLFISRHAHPTGASCTNVLPCCSGACSPTGYVPAQSLHYVRTSNSKHAACRSQVRWLRGRSLRCAWRSWRLAFVSLQPCCQQAARRARASPGRGAFDVSVSS
jgi:hypothetical protein